LTLRRVAAGVAVGRAIVLAAGVAVMLLINLVLMRRAVGPLERLRGRPLAPGKRVPYAGGTAELTDLAAAFNDMLDRLETERREKRAARAGRPGGRAAQRLRASCTTESASR
jgi:two-component system, NarL family, sensor histidine kinase UhpB